jgi:hypothetical protein
LNELASLNQAPISGQAASSDTADFRLKLIAKINVFSLLKALSEVNFDKPRY